MEGASRNRQLVNRTGTSTESGGPQSSDDEAASARMTDKAGGCSR